MQQRFQYSQLSRVVWKLFLVAFDLHYLQFQYSQLSRVVWKKSEKLAAIETKAVSVLSVESSGLEVRFVRHNHCCYYNVSVLSVESSGLEDAGGDDGFNKRSSVSVLSVESSGLEDNLTLYLQLQPTKFQYSQLSRVVWKCELFYRKV